MNYKLINDTIYGQISLSKIAISIIDTPVFQRLRNIKQLGACSYIFPTATHSRFEHSIGVAHLAKEFLKNLSENSENINPTKEDYLMVEIAGLCHDIGHGPFSHAFDNEFLPQVLNDKYNSTANIEHEDRSCMLLRYIVNKYNIELSDEQISTIINMINPVNPLQYGNKSYLYSIVSNSINSLDVDKIDYIQRDIKNLAIENGYNHSRLFKMCKVIDGEICIHEKEAYNLYEFFRLRYRLHKQFYNHPAVKAHEYMISDILTLIDPVLKMSDSISSPEDYIKYTDSILDIIEFLPDDENINKALQILNRIKCRDLYIFCGEHLIRDKSNYYIQKQNLIECIEKEGLNEYLIIHELNIGLCGGEDNPISNVRFYNKDNTNVKIDALDLSLFVSCHIKEFNVRFFIKEERYKKDIMTHVKQFVNLI